MNLSVCILAKNEEHCIENLLKQVRHHAEEIVLVDDHSTDRTVEIAHAYNCIVSTLPKPVSETGFAISNTYTIRQASRDWILFIDADELIPDIHLLDPLMRYQGKDVWALPRRKWIDYRRKQREEWERYPDWQVRFFRNKPTNKFVGEMHVSFSNGPIHYAYRGPHIEHLMHENRTPEKLEQRQKLYSQLANLQGVAIHGGDILPRTND